MIYFLIPVFNEAPNLGKLCRDLLAVLPAEEKHYVFVDDCSSDDSVDVIRGSMPPRFITILSNEVNSGPGACFSKGLNHILEHAADEDDRVVTMEGDNTCDLDILPVMSTLVSTWQFDVALASVYAQGGGFSKTSVVRKVISIVANALLRSAFDIQAVTLSSFYRVYSVRILRRIRTKFRNLVQEPGFICAFELLLKAVRVEARIIQTAKCKKSDLSVSDFASLARHLCRRSDDILYERSQNFCAVRQFPGCARLTEPDSAEVAGQFFGQPSGSSLDQVNRVLPQSRFAR